MLECLGSVVAGLPKGDIAFIFSIKQPVLLLLDAEDEGNIALRNTGNYLPIKHVAPLQKTLMSNSTPFVRSNCDLRDSLKCDYNLVVQTFVNPSHHFGGGGGTHFINIKPVLAKYVSAKQYCVSRIIAIF
jgi:hypothetical protein